MKFCCQLADIQPMILTGATNLLFGDYRRSLRTVQYPKTNRVAGRTPA